jgi:arylformamidase
MSEAIYKGFSGMELEFHFNPQVATPDHARWSEERRQASLKVRQTLRSQLDVPYGNSPRQVMDIFPAERRGAPVLLYFHGGYWRGGSKEDNCHFAELFVEAGATIAVVEYDLCPQVPVSEIVRQARAAIAWLYRNAVNYGGDSSRLYISGTSAGGHLVAMALAHDWVAEGLPRHAIKGAVAISGVYDLDAVLPVSVNAEIRLDPEQARENSPLLHPPLPYAPLLVAVGGAEPTGWKEMSKNFFALCQERGVACEYMEIPGANHFSLSAHLADPDSPLARAMLKQMGLKPKTRAAQSEIALLSAGAVKPGLVPLIAAFQRQSGCRIEATFATAPEIRKRVGSGEPMDVLIAPVALLDDLAKAGKTSAASRVTVGRIGVGVMVRAGAALPQTATVDEFKRSLLQADSVVYNQASTGTYLEGLFKRLGIGEQLKAKATRYPDAAAVIAHIIKGRGNEIGLGATTVIAEAEKDGLKLVGSLPAEIQNYTTYAATVIAEGPARQAAREFVGYLTTPAARATLAQAGIE